MNVHLTCNERPSSGRTDLGAGGSNPCYSRVIRLPRAHTALSDRHRPVSDRNRVLLRPLSGPRQRAGAGVKVKCSQKACWRGRATKPCSLVVRTSKICGPEGRLFRDELRHQRPCGRWIHRWAAVKTCFRGSWFPSAFNPNPSG